MQRDSVEAMLTLTAQTVRAKPDINPHLICVNVGKLQRIASSLHRRYENMCKHQWANEEDYLLSTATLEAKATRLAEEIGLGIEYQRDPGGWPLILTVGDYEIRLG